MHIEISVNGKDFVLERGTAQVFRFRKIPQADHAYYEDDETAFFIFDRHDLLAMMEAQGARTIIDDEPNETDMTAYVNWTMGALRPLSMWCISCSSCPVIVPPNHHREGEVRPLSS